MTSIPNALEPIRARLTGITQGDYDSVLCANRKWALVLRSPGTADEVIVAKCADDDDAHFFANAPADVARLLEILDHAANLIRDLTDPDACHFDHHGGCQAHGYLSLVPGEKCPQQEAKDLLSELEAAL